MKREEAYLLGALGDAYLDYKRNELQFYQKNKEWLEQINEILYKLIGEKGKISKRDVYLLRKRSKRLFQKLKMLQKSPKEHGEYFVAGLFDSEGSIYLSTKSKIPVVDITQSEKGLDVLKYSKDILGKCGIKSFLNGPYKHWNSKMKTYHLRVYGKQCIVFGFKIPMIHPEKVKRFMTFAGTVDPKL
jgi:intein-encoded DNA endonuclease-like protein